VNSGEKDFNSLLVKCIHETISSLLSSQVAEAIYHGLDTRYAVRKDDIPSNLDVLLSVIKEAFGPSSNVIGKAIAKRFYSQLGLEFVDNQTKTLIEYVEQARLISKSTAPER
jgi:hypothetical protein